jgi:hypothetical protein
MNDETNFRAALSRVGEALPRDVSSGAEQRLLAAFRARRKRARLLRIYAVGAVACLVLALTWFLSPRSPQVISPGTVELGGYQTATDGFVALPYAQSDVPMEEAVIVRLKLQRSELGSLGVPALAPFKTNGNINAELLVGQDGVARAVRVVQ